MPRIEVLDPEKHSGLRVQTDYSTCKTHLMPVVATELRELAIEYPVVLVKNPETGQFGLFALLGFRDGENLFLGEGGKWLARYLPLELRRQPFVVARGPEEGKGAIAIDIDHPLVSTSEGRPIFEAGDNPLPLIQDIQPILTATMSGAVPTEALISALAENELLAPGQIDVTAGETTFTLEGFYTISSQHIAQLSGETLAALNAKGLLYAIHLIMASMANVPGLLDRRSRD